MDSSSTSQAALERGAQALDQHRQQQIAQRQQEIGFDVDELLGHHLARRHGQLGIGDHRGERGLFHEQDGLVQDQRQAGAQGLRRLDAQEDLPPAQAHAARRLDLALGYRLPAAPENLGEVRAAIHRQRDRGRGKGVHRDACGRQAEVDDEQMDQEGHAAPHRRIRPVQPAQRRQPRLAQYVGDETQRQAAGQARGHQGQGAQRGQPEYGQQPAQHRDVYHVLLMAMRFITAALARRPCPSRLPSQDPNTKMAPVMSRYSAPTDR